MSTPILATKLHIPTPPAKVVARPQLMAQLDAGAGCKLTLVSAPAGFGKSCVVAQWVAQQKQRVAWVSLDDRDGDRAQFLSYVVAALQRIDADVGQRVMGLLQLPQLPSIDSILALLLNEIVPIDDDFWLVLDDYHLLDAPLIDEVMTFLVERSPPQMHLIIITREDPTLPLGRLRVQGELAELRVADLRFTVAEVAAFFNEGMGFELPTTAVTTLTQRTEGWVAGLQLAAVSMRGRDDKAEFIESFTGGHHFVLDYLVEEVLQQQTEVVQGFLLQTAVLDRFCASLCEAVMGWDEANATESGAATLAYLEQANLFIVPLDEQRRWYRYHHLFAELLRQRLQQRLVQRSGMPTVATLHQRASRWYEGQGLRLEAFHYATMAEDFDRATRLLAGDGMPLLFEAGAVFPILSWLRGLPQGVLHERPELMVMHASALIFVGELAAIEPKLQAAERVLQGAVDSDGVRDLKGHIAAIRATVAITQADVERIISQGEQALAYLAPHNLPVRTATTWALGTAYHMQGDRAVARRAYMEALSVSQEIGHVIITISSMIGLGNLQEQANELQAAAEMYQRVLALIGELPLPVACEAHLGLARVFYQWNELAQAEHHGQKGRVLAQQFDEGDRFVSCDLFWAQLKLGQGELSEAMVTLTQLEQAIRQHHFERRLPEVVPMRVRLLLQQGDVQTAVLLTNNAQQPLSKARAQLAQGDVAAALETLTVWRQVVEAKGWADEQLKVMLLQAIALYWNKERETAVRLVQQVVTLAEPNGFVRLFVDEGEVFVPLLRALVAYAGESAYVVRLLSVLAEEAGATQTSVEVAEALVEPLSERELEILRLIAQGLSNQAISEQLFLALSTVKGHNRNIFSKLQVRRRTEAVARARELGLL